MARFQITVPDGRTVMVDAANPQDAAEAADTWANQGRSPQMQKAVAEAAPIKPGAGGMMRAAVNGLTFNNGPEFNAAINAGETGLKNLVAHMTGQPDAGYGMSDAFKAAQMVERNAGQKFASDHPLLNVGGNLMGMTLNPAVAKAGKFVGGAQGVIPAMARSAAVSAPIGAAYGAGAAGPGHRAQGAVSGGITGAILGAAAPPLLAGGKALIGGAADVAGDVAQGARNLIHPLDPEAAAGAGDTEAAMGKLFDLARSKGIDIPTLSDPTGMGMTTAEAIGRPGVSSLGAIARRSGTTPDALEAQLRSRAANGPPTILDAFSAASGIHPDEAAGNVSALADRLQKEATPLFDAALSNARPGLEHRPGETGGAAGDQDRHRRGRQVDDERRQGPDRGRTGHRSGHRVLRPGAGHVEDHGQLSDRGDLGQGAAHGRRLGATRSGDRPRDPHRAGRHPERRLRHRAPRPDPGAGRRPGPWRAGGHSGPARGAGQVRGQARHARRLRPRARTCS
jgi:hypothetical protein